MKTVGIIGGDLRQVTVADEFLRENYKIYTFGLDYYGLKSDENAFNADIVLLPIPVNNNDRLNSCPAESALKLSAISEKLNCNVIFGGKFPKWFWDSLIRKNIKCHDILSRPEFPVYNAIATAEGAVSIAVSETSSTIFGSNILISGFGNIARQLSRILLQMGAKITIAARNPKQISEAECSGCKAIHINSLSDNIEKYDIIFNTVPFVLFTYPILEKINGSALIIDLASRPGGIDFDSAEELSKRVIWALGIPGKIAPVTSGIIIKKTVVNILKEMEE